MIILDILECIRWDEMVSWIHHRPTTVINQTHTENGKYLYFKRRNPFEDKYRKRDQSEQVHIMINQERERERERERENKNRNKIEMKRVNWSINRKSICFFLLCHLLNIKKNHGKFLGTKKQKSWSIFMSKFQKKNFFLFLSSRFYFTMWVKCYAGKFFNLSKLQKKKINRKFHIRFFKWKILLVIYPQRSKKDL